MENETNVQNQFLENLYDFKNTSFTDVVNTDDFKVMCEETINRCFDGTKVISYMVEISPYMTLLKHCSNFPTDEFTEDELYLICVYSNLEEVISGLNIKNDNRLYFILQNLEDCIRRKDNGGLSDSHNVKFDSHVSIKVILLS